MDVQILKNDPIIEYIRLKTVTIEETFQGISIKLLILIN